MAPGPEKVERSVAVLDGMTLTLAGFGRSETVDVTAPLWSIMSRRTSILYSPDTVNGFKYKYSEFVLNSGDNVN